MRSEETLQQKPSSPNLRDNNRTLTRRVNPLTVLPLHNNNPSRGSDRRNNGPRDSRSPRELCVVPSPGPCVALSSSRTNETVNQRSTLLIDPAATWRQLGYILKEECSFKKEKKKKPEHQSSVIVVVASNSPEAPFRRCELNDSRSQTPLQSSLGIIVKNESFRSKSSFLTGGLE